MPRDNRNEPLLRGEQAADWAKYLDQWEQEVYIPVFKVRGISRDTALLVWFSNKIHNSILDGDKDAEDWKP